MKFLFCLLICTGLSLQGSGQKFRLDLGIGAGTNNLYLDPVEPPPAFPQFPPVASYNMHFQGMAQLQLETRLAKGLYLQTGLRTLRVAAKINFHHLGLDPDIFPDLTRWNAFLLGCHAGVKYHYFRSERYSLFTEAALGHFFMRNQVEESTYQHRKAKEQKYFDSVNGNQVYEIGAGINVMLNSKLSLNNRLLFAWYPKMLSFTYFENTTPNIRSWQLGISLNYSL